MKINILLVFFVHFKHKARIYAHNQKKKKKKRINNHPLLFIHINTRNNYHKKYT